jgi:DNA polymerase I-like protein with 3'-5' exonuclease and polymerase domains
LDQDVAWALTATPDLPPLDGEAQLIATKDEADAALAACRAQSWTAFDVETVGIPFEEDFRVISLAVTPRGSSVGYVWDESALKRARTLDPLLAFLQDPQARKLGQNVKYDCMAVRACLGVMVNGVCGDTKLWRKLVNGDADAHLEVMQELIGMGGSKEEKELYFGVIRKLLHPRRTKAGKKAAPAENQDSELHVDPSTWDPALVAHETLTGKFEAYAHAFLPHSVLVRYNARDTVSTARLALHMEEEFKQTPQLWNVWERLAGPASNAIQHVEWWGVHVDRKAMSDYQVFLKVRIDAANEVFSACQVNPASPKQVAEYMFNRLGLPAIKGLSTDHEVLEHLQHIDKTGFVSALLDHRRFAKADGTYATGLEAFIRADGRIHPNFNIDGARSGRLSCSEPNLQNIPSPDRDEVLGKFARDMFSAPPGKVLLELDYSQLEIRVAAMLSGDKEMLRLLKSGEDFHLATAKLISQLVWGIPPEQVTSVHRRAAKTINFGLLYGQGVKALAAKAGITVDQAGTVKRAILGRFKQLDSWIKAQLNNARKTGECWTWWDGSPFRRRSLWQVGSVDEGQRGNAERSSWNTPIQGTGSDFCLASLVSVVDWILTDSVPAKLVLPVHDSLLFELDEDALEEVAYGAQQRMLSWNSDGVPLTVDMKKGRAWGSLEKFHLAA